MKVNLGYPGKIEFYSNKKKLGTIIFTEKGIRVMDCTISFSKPGPQKPTKTKR